MLLALILAQEAAPDPLSGIWDYVLQFGILGIGFLLLVLRKLRPEGEVLELQEIIRQKDETIARYQERYEEHIPLLAKAIELLPLIAAQAERNEKRDV